MFIVQSQENIACTSLVQRPIARHGSAAEKPDKNVMDDLPYRGAHP
jgi:hypothetical protein